MNSEQEILFDAIANWKSNDNWQFADKEVAWKFFFQAGAASRDAEVAKLINAVADHVTVRIELRAQINKLRESTELLLIARQIGHYRDEWDMLKEALSATPEQSLTEYRNKVIEGCAKRAEAYAYMSQNFNALAEELRAMKEPE